MRTWVLAGDAGCRIDGGRLAQDAAAGEPSFKKCCLPCHDAGEGAKIKLGPPLNGLDGRKAGTFAGFNYSDADKNSGITWNEASFKEYIKNPMQKIPGTRMAFAGCQGRRRKSTICGPTSSSSMRTARRSRLRASRLFDAVSRRCADLNVWRRCGRRFGRVEEFAP